MTPRFFPNREDLRRWFEVHGRTEPELWIGYHKKGTGRTGVIYVEAVEEALCVGWIDGQVRRIDEHSYTNRFTPRGPKSIWSRLNVRRVRSLIRDGRMRPEGLRAFRARTPERTGVYTFEQRDPKRSALDPASRGTLRANSSAFAYFAAQPPGYQRDLVRWIMSAKRPGTRAKRLDAVILASKARRRVDPLRPYDSLTPRGGG